VVLAHPPLADFDLEGDSAVATGTAGENCGMVGEHAGGHAVAGEDLREAGDDVVGGGGHLRVAA
jgi:hypothetical protein